MPRGNIGWYATRAKLKNHHQYKKSNTKIKLRNKQDGNKNLTKFRCIYIDSIKKSEKCISRKKKNIVRQAPKEPTGSMRPCRVAEDTANSILFPISYPDAPNPLLDTADFL